MLAPILSWNLTPPVPPSVDTAFYPTAIQHLNKPTYGLSQLLVLVGFYIWR